MLITPHALTGAAIGVLVPNPIVSIPIVIGSHFILDMVPHWQETLYPYKPNKFTWVRVPLDLFLALSLIYLIVQVHPAISSLIWVSAFSATIPDLDSLVSLSPNFLKNKAIKAYWDWHNQIQKETSSLLGLLPQLLWSLLCLFIGLR